MPKPTPSPKAIDNLKKYVSQELLGSIPLFFEQAEILEAKSQSENGPVKHRRDISVAAYQTSSFESRAYHKYISRIL